MACLMTAEYLWALHLIHAIRHGGAAAGWLAWTLAASWAQLLHLTAAMLAYAIFNVWAAVAASTPVPRLSEYIGAVVLAAAAITAVFLQIAFPNLAFGQYAPPAVALVAGAALALTWSSLAIRRPFAGDAEEQSGLDVFVAPVTPMRSSWPALIALGALPIATFSALGAVERTDWNFVVQKCVVVAQWVLTFGFIFSACRRIPRSPWSTARAVASPALALLMLMATARLSSQVPVWTGNPRIEAEVALDRYAGVDLSFKLLYDSFVEHPGRDPQFSRYLQANTAVSHAVPLVPPDVRFSDGPAVTGPYRPHVFLFVVDSLRRDYLSPFNAAVSFTPNIASLASESYAFQNAFSRYGGTLLAVPSIWSGGLVIHRTSMPTFTQSDALEKLLDGDRYQWFMGLDSVMAPLIGPRSDLVELDRGRRIMEVDLCQTFEELALKLDRRDSSRPAFAFSLPQNLHISKRQHAPVPPGERYPGFFEPYAAEVHRIDGCVGRFVSYLKRAGLYDDSIIVLTTDHGDSLGEDGNWGHSLTLSPEVIRIPLIVHVPERLRGQVTADLARVAFSTDIVPTLYALLGHSPRDLGPLFGSPLFVPRNFEPMPRRRQSFLIASSYAATYAALRRNGRSLYIADLVNGREYAYASATTALDTRVRVTDDLRRVSQRLIREQIGALADLYHFVPGP